MRAPESYPPWPGSNTTVVNVRLVFRTREEVSSAAQAPRNRAMVATKKGANDLNW